LVCGECGGHHGSDEPRRGGDAVRDAHEGAGVARGDVHVVDEVPGEGAAEEGHGEGEQGHGESRLGAVEEAEPHQEDGRQEHAEGCEELSRRTNRKEFSGEQTIGDE